MMKTIIQFLAAVAMGAVLGAILVECLDAELELREAHLIYAD